MGIIPHGEPPWGWAPTIRFGMAADAINVSETTYLTAVRYYLANLGTTMESQVRSSVGPFSYPLPYHNPSSLDPYRLPLRLAVCRASPSHTTLDSTNKTTNKQVTARLSRTRILAVTEAVGRLVEEKVGVTAGIITS